MSSRVMSPRERRRAQWERVLGAVVFLAWCASLAGMVAVMGGRL